jgi:succinyl-CoA synthetase beta subunit
MVMASVAGGVDIEEVAETSPEKILYGEVSSTGRLEEKEALSLAEGLGLRGSQRSEFINILTKLVKIFYECDASVVEINPLILTSSGHVLALDAKVNVEDSALFRQTKLEALRDPNQEDEKERIAREHHLNYVSLEGNIACMVNGAGLAMATMDLIKLHGGEPANFLDVGGDATASRVTEALKIILANKNVEAILVNIFGGIVRCDLIAEGIIDAVREVKMRIPVIVRLEGTNVEKGRMLLANSGLDIIAANNLTDAACKAIASVGSANP